MRIAFCLYGLSYGNNDKINHNNGKGDIVDFEIGYKYYKKNIFDINSKVDIFIHSWDNSRKDDILSLYKPTKYIFEKQIVFDKNDIRKHYHYSRWYSTQESIRLKSEYELETGNIYDFVMTARFDIVFMKPLDFSKIDNTYFYAGHWCRIYLSGVYIENQDYYFVEKYLLSKDPKDLVNVPQYIRRVLNKELTHKHVGYPYDNDFGFVDQWFFSNSEYIDTYAKIYSNIEELFKECGVSSHKMIKVHLEKNNILSKVKLMFHLHDDFPLVRRKILMQKEKSSKK